MMTMMMMMVLQLGLLLTRGCFLWCWWRCWDDGDVGEDVDENGGSDYDEWRLFSQRVCLCANAWSRRKEGRPGCHDFLRRERRHADLLDEIVVGNLQEV